MTMDRYTQNIWSPQDLVSLFPSIYFIPIMAAKKANGNWLKVNPLILVDCFFMQFINHTSNSKLTAMTSAS